MIQYLKNKQIDFKKYDACIETAINSRIYAYSWYLNIVADNWDTLVLNDYEAVMPLPIFKLTKAFFFKKIAQPNFCQQLGVFSAGNLSETISNNFLSNFEKLNFIIYNCNTFQKIENHQLKCSVNKKVNYELALFKSYQEIQHNYSKNLKRNLKKTNEFELEISTEISILEFQQMKKNNKKHTIKDSQFKKMKFLINELMHRNLGNIYGVYFEKNLISAAFFIEEKHRITHLFSSTTNKGKELGAIAFLFDTMIKKNAAKNIIFDFEGSMLPGVAKFFKSFGAIENNYYSLEK